MNIVISAHLDTVFKEPYCEISNGILEGSCDNTASILATAHLMDIPDIEIRLTEEEEMHMDGARYVGRDHNQEEDFIIVLDVTKANKGWKTIHFTVENQHGITDKHIRHALKEFKGQYKVNKDGEESEAWLYKELGFACVEIDIPVNGGLHSLNAKAKIEDILVVAKAVRALCEYIKGKTRPELSDIYKVGDERDEPDGEVSN